MLALGLDMLGRDQPRRQTFRAQVRIDGGQVLGVVT